MSSAVEAIESIQIVPQSVREQKFLPPGGVIQRGGNSYFELAHYYGWYFDADGGPEVDGPPLGEWLPNCGKVNHTPGCNGVTQDWKSKRINAAAAQAGVLRKKGLLIPPGDTRLGEFQHYVAAYPVQGGGAYHVYKWVKFNLLAGGRSSSAATVHNATETRRFLRHLYLCGMLPLMPREVLDKKIDIRQGRLRTFKERLDRGKLEPATYDRLVKECDAEIALWTAAFYRLHKVETPAPESQITITPAPVKSKPVSTPPRGRK